MNNKPIETIRSGSVKASIWANKGDDNQIFHTATISRSYTDGNGEWKETNTYLAQHLADLHLVAGEAFKFIRMGARAKNREHANDDNPPEEQHDAQQPEFSQQDEPGGHAEKESRRRGGAKSR